MLSFKLLKKALLFYRLYAEEAFNAQYRLISIDSNLTTSDYVVVFEDNYSKKTTSLSLEEVFLSWVIDRFDANDAKYIGMIYARCLFERQQDTVGKDDKSTKCN